MTGVSPRSIEATSSFFRGQAKGRGWFTDGGISARSGERRWNAVAITASFGRIDATSGARYVDNID